MAAPDYWKRATRELAQRDPVMARITRNVPGITLNSRGDAFSTLARAIVGQQISVKAAQSIWERFSAAAGKLNPHAVHALEHDALRACGLSRGKAVYINDLARHFVEARLTPRRWHAMEDEALIEQLTRVKGVGRWTAEMFLIFHLTRPDVFPVGDLGLRRALEKHYNDGRPLSARKLARIETNLRPWRSVATWYLWRSLDADATDY